MVYAGSRDAKVYKSRRLRNNINSKKANNGVVTLQVMLFPLQTKRS